MPGHHPVPYARICYRLQILREHDALALLGLPGVASKERSAGAANRTYFGRFDAPGFPVLYAAEEVATCEAEVAHHLLAHYLELSVRKPRDFRYQVLRVPLAGHFDDLHRADRKGLCAPSPSAYPAARKHAWAACEAGLDGLLYPSPRKAGGHCVARFLLGGIRIQTDAVGFRSFHWSGRRLTRVP